MNARSAAYDAKDFAALGFVQSEAASASDTNVEDGKRT